MPRVPTYDGLQVGRNTLPNAQLRGASSYAPVQDVAGQQAQQMGRAMQQFGGEIGRIALDMQHEANQLRVTDALSGLFFIFGLAGVALWARGRRG